VTEEKCSKLQIIGTVRDCHGGTGFCGTIGRNGMNGDKAPAFACAGVGKDNPDEIPTDIKQILQYNLLWPCNKTDEYIHSIRPYYHFIGSEFRNTPKRKISDMNLEHPQLVSIVIMRDPISRLMGEFL